MNEALLFFKSFLGMVTIVAIGGGWGLTGYMIYKRAKEDNFVEKMKDFFIDAPSDIKKVTEDEVAWMLAKINKFKEKL